MVRAPAAADGPDLIRPCAPNWLSTSSSWSCWPLLYLFFARVLWAVWSEVRTDRRVVASHAVNERAPTRAAPVPKPRKAPKGKRGRVGRIVILEPKAKRGTTFALTAPTARSRSAVIRAAP